MPATPTSLYHPKWESDRLRRKYAKHGTEVAELLSLPPAEYEKGHYANDSKLTLHSASLHFEAEHYEGNQSKHPPSSYFTDDRMLLAITDPGVTDFKSFYPKRCGITLADYQTMQPGDRLMQFRRWLLEMETGQIYQKVHRRHGF